MAQQQITLSGQSAGLLKLALPGTSLPPVITDKERANFYLEENGAILDEHISKTRSKIAKLTADIKDLLVTGGSRKSALVLL